MLRVTAEADPLAREDLAFALSVVLLGLLMMVTRRNAVSQVVGFMSRQVESASRQVFGGTMLLPSELERALPRDDEQHLLPVVRAAFEREARRIADHVLLEPLAAVRGVDRRPDLGCVAGRANARNVLLRYDEALCDPHPCIVTTRAAPVNAAAMVEA